VVISKRQERTLRALERNARGAEPARAAAVPVALRPRQRRGWGPLPSLALGVVALAIWQLLVSTGSVAEYLLPAPWDVARAFWSALNDGLLWRYGRVTLTESLLGFGFGALVALPIGYAIAASRVAARIIEPYLAASQAVPAVALAPLLVLWLGYGLRAVVVLCMLIVFFPMVVNTTLGVRGVERDVLDAARVDGAGRWQLLWHFEAPLALPTILAGMRAGLTLSITGAVVGEFVLGDRGLGGLLTVARANFDTPLVYATLFTLMLLAAALYGVARLAERWLSYLES
jgi:NitT/TauT family transport system permease protein